MIDKTVIYNIACLALGSNYQTVDPDNDSNKIIKSLRLVFPLAVSKVLADLDLNRTSTKIKLQVLDKTHPHWDFVYRYPTSISKFRKVVSPFPTDNKETKVESATETVDGLGVILTDESGAYADVQPSELLSFAVLSVNGAYCIGYQMALMVPALIVGKDGKFLKQQLLSDYVIYKAEAQRDDQNENVDNTSDEFKSEYIQARMGGRQWPTKT